LFPSPFPNFLFRALPKQTGGGDFFSFPHFHAAGQHLPSAAPVAATFSLLTASPAPESLFSSDFCAGIGAASQR
jgi:hypothetical protein